jgi:hypothetical protein
MGSCSAPSPQISADRTLLLQIEPFVQLLTASWAFLRTCKHAINCAKRQLSLLAEFGGLNVPSLELDAEHAHYASFIATLANLTTDHESLSLGPWYGLIRQEVLNVATSTLPWAVQLRNSYDSISTVGGILESDLVVLTNTRNQDLSD